MDTNLELLFNLNPKVAFSLNPEWVIQNHLFYAVEYHNEWIDQNKSEEEQLRIAHKIMDEYEKFKTFI